VRVAIKRFYPGILCCAILKSVLFDDVMLSNPFGRYMTKPVAKRRKRKSLDNGEFPMSIANACAKETRREIGAPTAKDGHVGVDDIDALVADDVYCMTNYTREAIRSRYAMQEQLPSQVSEGYATLPRLLSVRTQLPIDVTDAMLGKMKALGRTLLWQLLAVPRAQVVWPATHQQCGTSPALAAAKSPPPSRKAPQIRD